MISLIEILMFYQEEQLLKLLKIQNTMNISMNMHQWFKNFLIKSLLVLLLATINFEKRQLAEELNKPIISKLLLLSVTMKNI